TFGAAPYKPLPPPALYLTKDEWSERAADLPVMALTPFEAPSSAGMPVVSFGGRRGHNFAAERAQPGANVYEAVRGHVNGLRKAGKRTVIAAWTEGSRERLEGILRDHEVSPLASA